MPATLCAADISVRSTSVLCTNIFFLSYDPSAGSKLAYRSRRNVPSLCCCCRPIYLKSFYNFWLIKTDHVKTLWIIIIFYLSTCDLHWLTVRSLLANTSIRFSMDPLKKYVNRYIIVSSGKLDSLNGKEYRWECRNYVSVAMSKELLFLVKSNRKTL